MVFVTRGGAARLARVAHNHKVAGSNPAPATKKDFEAIQSLFCLPLIPFTRAGNTNVVLKIFFSL